MYGTPWHGEAEISSPGDAPLAAIFLLEQSPRSEVREIDSSEAIARLFGCTFPLFYDGVSLAFTLGFLGELVTSGLVRVLDFRPDASAVAAVREHSLFGRE
jgi:hypothetical protein